MTAIATSNAAPIVNKARARHSLPLHRIRFADYTPAPIATLTITPPSFDTTSLQLGGASHERGVMGVGRANGDVELFIWGGLQGWISWRVSPYRQYTRSTHIIYVETSPSPHRHSSHSVPDYTFLNFFFLKNEFRPCRRPSPYPQLRIPRSRLHCYLICSSHIK